MTRLAFVDIETTGLDPDVHELWEVGLILRGEAGGESEHSWQLSVDLGRADPRALDIGRYYERKSGRPVQPTSFARKFAELTHGAHLVGAVPSFDEERLRRFLRAHGACPGWHYHLIDVEALAAGWLVGTYTAIQEVGKNPDADGPTEEEARRAAPPWDSNALSLAVGVDPEDFDRHTALGDARWAKAIYDAVMGRP